MYSKIILPTRAQVDTIATIFILKKLGREKFPGVEKAVVEIWAVVPGGETEETLDRQGIVLLDLGGGRFDHHNKAEKTTALNLVAEYLGVKDDPALQKLIKFVERDDFYGKGIISEDSLDRAFGLPGLISNLNKEHSQNPGLLVDIIYPLIEAHYAEEVRRTKELPEEFEKKLKSGEAEVFSVKQGGKSLRVVMVVSENTSLAGFLRSQLGGRHDVVAQYLPSGHLNILTRPTKQVDLRLLAAALRAEEVARAGRPLPNSSEELIAPGRLPFVPEWYYDPATNSIQNGGINPKGVPPTKIARPDLKRILELGLS